MSTWSVKLSSGVLWYVKGKASVDPRQKKINFLLSSSFASFESRVNYLRWYLSLPSFPFLLSTGKSTSHSEESRVQSSSTAGQFTHYRFLLCKHHHTSFESPTQLLPPLYFRSFFLPPFLLFPFHLHTPHFIWGAVGFDDVFHSLVKIMSSILIIIIILAVIIFTECIELNEKEEEEVTLVVLFPSNLIAWVRMFIPYSHPISLSFIISLFTAMGLEEQELISSLTWSWTEWPKVRTLCIVRFDSITLLKHFCCSFRSERNRYCSHIGTFERPKDGDGQDKGTIWVCSQGSCIRGSGYLETVTRNKFSPCNSWWRFNFTERINLHCDPLKWF